MDVGDDGGGSTIYMSSRDTIQQSIGGGGKVRKWEKWAAGEGRTRRRFDWRIESICAQCNNQSGLGDGPGVGEISRGKWLRGNGLTRG